MYIQVEYEKSRSSYFSPFFHSFVGGGGGSGGGMCACMYRFLHVSQSFQNSNSVIAKIHIDQCFAQPEPYMDFLTFLLGAIFILQELGALIRCYNHS